jgi:hypothetical protein
MKASYEKPKLLVFGDVKELTQAAGKTGAADGGKGSKTQTLP